jgi:hypothetical protein
VAGKSFIWLSVTQSMEGFYRNIVQTNISYPKMETPVFPFELKNGDMVKFRDQINTFQYTDEELYWPESEEYRVVSTDFTFDANNNRRVVVYLNRALNPGITNAFSFSPTGSAISYYIFNKHIPDETNVILRYNPKANITQDGMLFPEYIEKETKDASGNTIKSLKDQNLI